MTTPVRPGQLTTEEARTLTDEVKADAAALWRKMLRLYEGNAHLALGFKSWGSYYAAEFGGGRAYGYRLLDAARVLEQLHPPTDANGEWQPHSTALQSPMGDSPSERVAREMVPLLRNGGDAVREAWEETVGRHGPEPTAVQVREVVLERQDGSRPESPRQPSWAARMQLLAGELRQVARYGPVLDHCETALSLIPDVTADLERLLPDEAGRG
jgi:hypothetical protein